MSLRREPVPSLERDVVAAYYEDERVGYLSSDNHSLRDILERSAGHQGKVVGEILDEDGGLVGLDIEFSPPPGESHELPSLATCEVAEMNPWRGKTLRAIMGLTVLLLMVLVDPEDIGSVSYISALSAVANKPLPLIAPSETMSAPKLAQVVRLSLSEQVKYMSMLNVKDRIVSKDIATDSAEQMQAQELNRIVQQAAAYRLAQDRKRRAEAAQQAQANTQQLVKVLHQARQTVARERSRLGRVEKLAFRTDPQRHAANATLERNIALSRPEEEERQQAFRELNQEELVRYKIRMSAWTLADRQQTRQGENFKRTQRNNNNPVSKAALVVKVDKPAKKRVKANFSRYAQQNRNPDKNQSMPE